MRKIIHIDMDAFFASVEQRDRPELRGKPVIVGGSPRRRGVVSTCSYEARKFGVHSAMATATALRRCPEAVLLSVNFRKYAAVSREVRAVFREVTDRIEPVSIDEAYLDVTVNRLGESSAVAVAEYILRRIRETTGLTASAGVSFNKFLAKTASDFRKPAGLTEITPEQAAAFLDALPVEKFHGIGRVSARRLTGLNVRTGKDLRRLSRETLRALFGKSGDFYYDIVRCRDDRPVESGGAPKSISREHTLPEDVSELRRLRVVLRSLSRNVMAQADKRGVVGRSVTVKVKYGDFRTSTRTLSLPHPVTSGERLGALAVSLLARTEAGRVPVRLIGVGIGDLEPPDARPLMIQPEFPEFRKLFGASNLS